MDLTYIIANKEIIWNNNKEMALIKKSNDQKVWFNIVVFESYYLKLKYFKVSKYSFLLCVIERDVNTSIL